MYYIQNYTVRKELSECHSDSVDRFLEGEYVGSDEFGPDSVQNAWSWLRANSIELFSHEVQSKGGKAKKVVFYVITNLTTFDRFKQEIDIHLDGTIIRSKAKRYTYLWEKFNSWDTFHGYLPDAWLDVSKFVGLHSNFSKSLVDGAIFFTRDPWLAVRTFLELNRGMVEMPVCRISDEVYSYHGSDAFQVCGFNADNSISIKHKDEKPRKTYSTELWHKKELEVCKINDRIHPRELKLNI